MPVIDLHNHLLPGVDDGSTSPDMSRRMLARSAQLGYRTIVATPHLRDRLLDDQRTMIESRLADIRPDAATHGVTVVGGYEVFLTPDLPTRLEQGEPSMIAGTRSILVELPFVGWPTYTESTIFALQTAGYRPILAHPERYQAVQHDPALAIALARRGALLQLTLGSLIGSSRRIQKVSEQLLTAGAITLVASDAHGDDHRLAAVPDALQRLEHLVGREHLDQIVRINPEAVLNDGPIVTSEPTDGQKSGTRQRRWWQPGRSRS